jgi:hypothetical protein
MKFLPRCDEEKKLKEAQEGGNSVKCGKLKNQEGAEELETSG